MRTALRTDGRAATGAYAGENRPTAASMALETTGCKSGLTLISEAKPEILKVVVKVRLK